MTSREPDFDSFVDALRADLPSTSDERRVRNRLLAAGIGVATSTVAPAATATGLAGGASLPAGLLQKFGALSWTVKVGLASVAATAALPATMYLTSAKQSLPGVEVAPAAQRVAARSVPASSVTAALRVPEPNVTAEAPRAAERESAAMPKPVSPSPGPSDVGAPQLAARASSAAFPSDEGDGAQTRSTLAEETALVERALYALKRGDRDGARRTLAEHARRFPSGLLARERDRALERANAGDEQTNPAASP